MAIDVCRLLRATWIRAWLIFAVACGDGEEAGRFDDSDAPGLDTNSSEPEDPNCHYDCFGFHECRDGVVTTWEHVPVPCKYYTGECPHRVSYTCERGCRVDVDTIYDPWLSPREMCEEWRPKQEGDPCDEPGDCEPQVAVVDGQGYASNVYLRCDEDAGMCVARDAPIVEDYLAPCGIQAPFKSLDGYEFGFVRTDACSGGVCLISEDETCVRQGCTIRCDSDDDCPQGATCRLDWYDWTPPSTNAGGGDVCKPGHPNNPSFGLSCP